MASNIQSVSCLYIGKSGRKAALSMFVNMETHSTENSQLSLRFDCVFTQQQRFEDLTTQTPAVAM